MGDFECRFQRALEIVDLYVLPCQGKRIVVAVIDAAVASLATFDFGGVANGFAWVQRFHIAVVIGQRDAVLLDAGYSNVAEPRKRQSVQLCLEIAILVFPLSSAAD